VENSKKVLLKKQEQLDKKKREGLLELIRMFSIYKKTREIKGKYYDNSKMMGV